MGKLLIKTNPISGQSNPNLSPIRGDALSDILVTNRKTSDESRDVNISRCISLIKEAFSI